MSAPRPALAPRLSSFVAGLSLDQVAAETRSRAKLLLLDAVGAALAASSFDFGRRAVRGLSSLDSGDARIVSVASVRFDH